MANILNCQPGSGNVITDTDAKISFYGEYDTISNIYLNARKNQNGEVAGQGDFDHLDIAGVILDKSNGKVFYEALWYQFFKENKGLIDKVRSYDDYSDGLPTNSINSAARVFYILKKYGINGLGMNVKEFTTELKKQVKKSSDDESSFSYLDQLVKKTVRTYYGKLSKDEMLQLPEIETNPQKSTIRRLIDIRYDETDGNVSEAYTRDTLVRIKKLYEDEKNGADREAIKDRYQITLE